MTNYLFIVYVLVQSVLVINGNGTAKTHEFKLCQTHKHCVKCTQQDIGYGRYYIVPDQETFLKSLIDKFNDFRSWYAKEFEIGNMRFVKWNFELYSLAEDTANMIGNAELSCTTIGTPSRSLQRLHSLVDFTTLVKTVLDVNGTHNTIFQDQLNVLANHAINSSYLVKHNVNEFGCSYSFKPLISRTSFLLRCIFYVDKDITSGEILSPIQCSNCTEAESCIQNKFPGLCVSSNSTEKYVQNLLVSQPSDSYAGASMAGYIKLYLFVTTILVVLCEILLINKI